MTPDQTTQDILSCRHRARCDEAQTCAGKRCEPRRMPVNREAAIDRMVDEWLLRPPVGSILFDLGFPAKDEK